MNNTERISIGEAEKKAIVLFDGVCNLCNGTVRFLIRHDRKNHFLFTSLQGDAGLELLSRYQLPNNDLSSFVLIQNGKAYTQSTAALRVLRTLGFPFSIAYPLILLPASIRNFFYDLIARNRYRWFGKQEECWVPTPELKKRFL